MVFDLLAPSITIPSRIVNNSRGTLIENIFTNSILPEIVLEILVSISDHPPSLLIVPVENKRIDPQEKIQYTT